MGSSERVRRFRMRSHRGGAAGIICGRRRSLNVIELIEKRVADRIREYRVGQFGIGHDLINVASDDPAGEKLLKAACHGIKVDRLYVLQLSRWTRTPYKKA